MWWDVIAPIPNGWSVRDEKKGSLIRFVLIAPCGKEYFIEWQDWRWYSMNPNIEKWRNEIWADVLRQHNFMEDGTPIVDAEN